MAYFKIRANYDIIFAGGGTTACIAAGRLAKANPNLSILLVERGRYGLNDEKIVTPAMFSTHFLPENQSMIFYKANEEKTLNDRAVVVSTGGVLGGGSAVNCMMYTRASAVDFDSWNTDGWDAKSLVPFAKKLETYHSLDTDYDPGVHGFDGPIHVSRGTYTAEGAVVDFLAAAKSVGEREALDIQDFKTCDAVSRWYKYIGPDGKRQDAAHKYIHPLLASGNYPNLHILEKTTVIGIQFDGVRAVGVECQSTPEFLGPGHCPVNPVQSIAATKLVVVSAGALSTPSILERSGIGKADLLRGLDINIITDLPGVGEEYQDHNLMLYRYKTSLAETDSLDALLSGRVPFSDVTKEMAGWNGVDVGGKFRPREDEVTSLGIEFKARWERDFRDHPERPLMLMAAFNGFLGDHPFLNEPTNEPTAYVTIATYSAYPYSRGNIHIVSKDPTIPVSFDTGFLSDQFDLTGLVWAYKKQREIYRRTNAYAGEFASSHPNFPDGSNAACRSGSASNAGFKSVEDRQSLPILDYSEADDEAIEEFIRSNVASAWHSLGTCKMAPRNEGGVVDRNLNVYGTKSLKCADLSIVPENVGANTNNTALIIGEKAAAIIGEELGLSI